MKISICGKGGSGKSVLTVLMARVLASRGYQVIVLDTDESNLGLHRMLGSQATSDSIMTALGGKSAFKEKLRSAFSKQAEETEIAIFSKSAVGLSDLPLDCIAQIEGIRVLSIGKIERPLEGCACPMGVLARDLVTKFTLADKEILLIDTEAGVEHFGRGVESSVDVILTVVEPSFESILLAEKINNLASELRIKAMTILNKTDAESENMLRAQLKERGGCVAGSLDYDQEVFHACLSGNPVRSTSAEERISKVVDSLGL